MHLRSLSPRGDEPLPRGFPFDLPLIQNLGHIDFAAPVTFFVGENGSGKSTLLEALAIACELPSWGSDDAERDESLGFARALAEHLRLSWKRKTRRGFWMRAEDFLGGQRRSNALRAELSAQVARYDAELDVNPDDFGLQKARGYIQGQVSAIERSYGADAEARSHGEAFLHVFEQRLCANGLFILDEPETPLSPLRQLAFLAMMKDAVMHDGQFIIATHSPILMAFEDAQIWNFDEPPPRVVSWDETEHVKLTKAFLNAPQNFLRRL